MLKLNWWEELQLYRRRFSFFNLYFPAVFRARVPNLRR